MLKINQLITLALLASVGPNHARTDRSGGYTRATLRPIQSNYGIPVMKDGFTKLTDMLESIDIKLNQMSARIDRLEELVANNPVIQRIESVTTSLQAKIQSLERRVDKPLLDAIIRNPEAKLFKGENFTGEIEVYDIDSTGWGTGCQNLGNLNNSVASASTFGKCVRLFQEPYCDGVSLAVYPGSEKSRKVLSPELTSVSSVGPCLTEEFDHANFGDLARKTIVKNVENLRENIPDLLTFPGIGLRTSVIEVSNEFSVRRYVLGPNKRPEYLVSVIKSKHLGITTELNAKMEDSVYFRSLKPVSGDVVGYGVPVELGGPANLTYNIFPQTSAGAEQWRLLTSEVPDFLMQQDTNYVILGVQFYYADDWETRPYAFTYNIFHNGTKLYYGRVQN